jgi:hypothetical protein
LGGGVMVEQTLEDPIDQPMLLPDIVVTRSEFHLLHMVGYYVFIVT